MTDTHRPNEHGSDQHRSDEHGINEHGINEHRHDEHRVDEPRANRHRSDAVQADAVRSDAIQADAVQSGARQVGDPFLPPDAGHARAHRNHAALMRIGERHGTTDGRRRRWSHSTVLDPYEAVCLIMALAGGSALLDPDEAPLDQSDLTAALTLIPHVRADLETLEAGLLNLARSRGLTWQAIAFGLGLGTAQAARQRFDRLTERTRPDSSTTE